MKILVVGIQTASPEGLLKDERLENCRRMMEIGCFGRLICADVGADGDVWFASPGFQGKALVDYLTSAGRRVLVAGGEDAFVEAVAGLETAGYEAVLVFGAPGADPSGLDEKIGELLERIDNDTLVLIVFVTPAGSAQPDGAFLLAAALLPLLGELENTHLEDLAPTVLEIAGYRLQPIFAGRSLAEGTLQIGDQPLLNEEEEAILRERLSGLGYI
jgi:hypothetical protein